MFSIFLFLHTCYQKRFVCWKIVLVKVNIFVPIFWCFVFNFLFSILFLFFVDCLFWQQQKNKQKMFLFLGLSKSSCFLLGDHRKVEYQRKQVLSFWKHKCVRADRNTQLRNYCKWRRTIYYQLHSIETG